MTNTNPEKSNFKIPRYRHKLKAQIHLAGFRTAQEFAKAAGLDTADLSKTLNGIMLPPIKIQKKIAATLGLSLSDLSHSSFNLSKGHAQYMIIWNK